MDKILILMTGGTIDDLEYDAEEHAPIGRSSNIPRLLQELKVKPDVTTRLVALKDSQFITDDDRLQILESIQSSNAKMIIITHGTKTMSQTAKFLGSKIEGKTVVLTGCMILPRHDKGEDARKHLAFALEKVQSIPFGVYIAMQNEVFDWDNVQKNVEKGQFETER